MKQVIKNILTILSRREKKKLWLLTLADICINVVDIAFLVVLLYVIRFYTQPVHEVSIRGFSLAVFNAHPVLLITFFFLLFGIKNTAGFLVSKMQYRFVYAVASRISRELTMQYLNGSYQDYVNVDSSVINRKISQEPIEFCHYVLNGMQQVFSQALLVLITIVAVFILNPLLFPLLVLMLAPPVLLVAFLMKRRLDSARLYGKKTSERSIQHLQEALSGFVDSNIYQKNTFFINRYHRLQAQLNHYLAERLIIQNMPPRLIEVFAVFGLLILVTVNFIASNGNSIQLVTIGALMVAAYKIIPGIVKITNTMGQVKTYAFAAEDLSAVVHAPVKTNFYHLPLNTIVFENVCFNYPAKKVLSSFSVSMERGDFTVISGASGKGKTTFVHLLLGFLTPSSGVIYFNGQPADMETRQQYWSTIAYVKQQPFFLHASVIENIVLEEGDYDAAKIKKVAAVSGVDKLVAAFPEGLHMVITENGKNLSGGQRQRIIFARALYKDADLLILDEPFSELDEASETKMLSALQTIAAAGKMVILITHNRKAMAFGNKKILMDE